MGLSESKHSELIRRAANGDAVAIDDLMQAHRERLKQMVCLRMDPRLVARVDPSDVIQETLTKATQNLPQYLEDQPIPFYPWLRRIAWQQLMYVHRQHLDAEKRTVRREQRRAWCISDNSSMHMANMLAGGLSTPSAILSKQETCQRVREALEQLEETDREVLLQRYVEQSSVQEIAAVLESSEAAIYKRLARALEKFQSSLEKGPP
jgi:RNA polymerase sigma-70 factor (ECF subfamily)